MAIEDDIKAYVKAIGQEPLAALQAASAGRVLILGEYHTALFRSLEILEALVDAGGFRYFANEWLLNAGPIRRGLRAAWHGGDPEAVLEAPSTRNPGDVRREAEGFRARYDPWVPVVRRLSRMHVYHLAIGTSANGAARDRRIAGHYVDETVDRRLSRSARGIALLGAFHAAATEILLGRRTSRQILEGLGWEFVTAAIYEGSSRASEGFTAHDDRGHVTPLGGGSSFLLAGLLPSGVDQLAVQTRQDHGGNRSPFFSVGDAYAMSTGSASSSSIADLFEIVILARDP